MPTSKKPPAPIEMAALFKACMGLAQTVDYNSLTLAKVAVAAKLPVARLKAEFVDVKHLVIALQQHFINLLRDTLITGTLKQSAGLERVHGSTLAYLDHCLAHRLLRQWLLQARHHEPKLAEDLRRQNQAFILVMSTEFHAMGWPHPQAAARLYLAAMQETARQEQMKGHTLPAIREAIRSIARHYSSVYIKSAT